MLSSSPASLHVTIDPFFLPIVFCKVTMRYEAILLESFSDFGHAKDGCQTTHLESRHLTGYC